MAAVTIDQIKKLREATGIGMKICQKALVEANGDMELAINNLRKQGLAAAMKKQDRATNEGMIVFAENNDLVAVAEVNAETDFVVKNERFVQFANDVVNEVLNANPSSLEDFLSKKYSQDPSISMEEFRAHIVQTIGENIQISRVHTVAKSSDKSVGVYSHLGGKIVVVVEIEGKAGEEALAKDIAMHAAATAPAFLSPETVTADVLENEREIARSQMAGKPENMIEKIVEGKLQAYYKDQCLSEQPYIKDEKKSIKEVVAERSKEINTPLKLSGFIRWAVGQ